MKLKPFILLLILCSNFAYAESTMEDLSSLSPDLTPEIEAQTSGAYPPLERTSPTPLGMIQHAWDTAPATAGVYTVQHRADQVIRLRTREFMTTSLIFPSWEKIEIIEKGDPTFLTAEAVRPNIVLLRPQQAIGADTSLTLIGASGIVYTFYVRNEGYNSTHVSDLAVHIRVASPPVTSMTSPSVVPPKTAPDYLETLPVAIENLDFNFSMSGDPSIAPKRVFSDGIRTWFDYGEDWNKKDYAVIHRVVDGIDTPVPARQVGTLLVVATTGTFVLRNGQRVTCVYPTPKGKNP